MVVTGCVAQLVEQLTLNQWVQGSSPCASTKNKKTTKVVVFIFGRYRLTRIPLATKLPVGFGAVS